MDTLPAAQLEESCAWRVAGADPWRGDTAAALVRMGIPLDQAQAFARRIAAKDADGRAVVTRKGVWDDKAKHYAMEWTTHGNTMCHHPRVWLDAVPGALYRAGKWTVILPDVCQNVSLLLADPLPPGTPGVPVVPSLPGVPPADAVPPPRSSEVPPTVPQLPPGPMYRADAPPGINVWPGPVYLPSAPRSVMKKFPLATDRANAIPEPGILWLVLPALVWLTRRAQG